MRKAIWYFDFLSPYAYLQSAIIGKLTGHIFLEPKPVLFAGILNHHGQLGPAEIPSKRDFIFKQSLWLAKKYNIALKLPPFHPFNPLPALRLATAVDGDIKKILRIFDFIWREGGDIEDHNEFQKLGNDLGVKDPHAVIQLTSVKQKLKEETDRAISQGVFGVPSIVLDKQIFWGLDATDFVLDYLQNPVSIKQTIINEVLNFKVGKAKRKKPNQ